MKAYKWIGLCILTLILLVGCSKSDDVEKADETPKDAEVNVSVNSDVENEVKPEVENESSY